MSQFPGTPISSLPIAISVNPVTDYAVGVTYASGAYTTVRVSLGQLVGPAGPTGATGATGPAGTGNVSTSGTPTINGIPIWVTYAGGTGSIGTATAAQIRSAASAAALGANGDITSLTGLTTALSVAQGGTGANAAGATAAHNIGAAATSSNLSDLASTSTALTNLGGLSTATASATYLTISTASATYLTSATAASTYAPLASPALTGTPTVPTATVGTNTTQAASTAFVLANAGGGGSAAPGSVNAQSSAYTVVTGDKGKVIECTGSFTLTLPAAPGTGFYCFVRKRDPATGGVVVITPTTVTIDTLASINLYQESYLIWFDGTNYRSQGRLKGWVNIASAVAASVANVTFTTGFSDTELRDMEIEGNGVTLAANNNLLIRVQKSGTVVSGTTYTYSNVYANSTTSASSNGGTGQTGIASAALGATVQNMTVKVTNFASGTGTLQRIVFNGLAGNTGGAGYYSGEGYETTNLAIQAIVLVPGSGNIATGNFDQRAFRP